MRTRCHTVSWTRSRANSQLLERLAQTGLQAGAESSSNAIFGPIAGRHCAGRKPIGCGSSHSSRFAGSRRRSLREHPYPERQSPPPAGIAGFAGCGARREPVVRIHRSAIVNIDMVDELRQDAHGEYVVVLRKAPEFSAFHRQWTGGEALNVPSPMDPGESEKNNPAPSRTTTPFVADPTAKASTHAVVAPLALLR